MRMRTWAGALLLAAWLAGCTVGGTRPLPSPPAGPGQSTAPAGTGEATAPGGTGTTPSAPGATGGTPAPTGGGTKAEFPVRPAPGALERIAYDSTLAIPGPGTYLVDLPTGKVESWRGSGEGSVALSEDRRWVVSQTGTHVYWANRATGQVYGWPGQDLVLLTAGANRFLFGRPGGRTYYVTDDTFQVLCTFTLELGQRTVDQAQFANDGKTVAINTARWLTVDSNPADGRLYVVDTATGAVRDLGAPPTPAAGRLVGAELLGPAGGELVVSFVVQTVAPTGLTREQSILRRYSWHGELLGEFPVAGRASRLSPDGRLLLAGQELQYLTQGVLLTDMATGQPLFRVAGAGSAGWMAGGAGVVLEGTNGLEYLVSTAGALSPAPRTPPGGQMVFDGYLKPAPGDAHRFLAGLAVVDESGTVLKRIDLPTDKEWLIRDATWGAGDNEVVIMISPPVGKGHIGFDFPLAPVVQRPPFPEPYLLTVQDPRGECLNLRESHARESRVIRCLPTGTGLAVGDLWQAPEKLNGATYFDDGHMWLWARTEQGETGWVALDTGSVAWR